MQNKHLLYSLCLASLFAISTPMQAQQNNAKQATTQQDGITVTGTVVDDKGESIIGASVKVQGASTGTITDFDGNFTLKNIPKGAKLEVSYIGYTNQVISNLNNPRIVMKEDLMKLDEVVVVGYGAQKMKNVTGSIETISADELKDLSVGSLGDALSGMMNGLHVNAQGSRPGSSPTLQIRQSSVNTAITPNSTRGGDADTRPLYVIDDFISTEDAFNNLDVSEVESITVLKDASAAVYGARAAYGVVLVKTKRGQVGTPKISYSGQFGFTDALDLPDMLSAYDYGRIYNAVKAAGTATKDNEDDDFNREYFQLDELEAMKHLNYNLLDREWSSALTQRHNININGGTEKATYFAGVSYYQQDGNIGRLDYERWNFRAGVNANISKWVKASLQVSGDYGEKNSARNGISGGGTDGDFQHLMTHLPFVPDYINGHYIAYTGMENETSQKDDHLYNFAAVQNSPDNVENQSQNMALNASLEYDFGWSEILKGLKIKASYSKSIADSKNNSIGTTMSVYRLINRTGSGQHLYTGEGVDYSDTNFGEFELNNGNQLSRSMSRSDSYQMNLTVSYARDFGLHSVSGLFSVEKAEAETEDLNGSISDPLSFTDGQSSSTASNSTKSTTFGRTESGMLSYIGRFNYSYADKYLLEFLIRSDASTKFAPENYWGVFPSVSAGWVISEESWFNKDTSGIDFLKIRGSFGLLGRDNVKAWIWTQLYSRNPDKGPIFGTSETTQSGATMSMPKQGVNRDVHWDKNYKTNFGIDLRMLNSRLSVTLDAYYDMGRDLFATHTGAIYYPTTVGTQATPENFGEIDTYGVELSLGWRDKIGKDFSYNIKVNTGYSDNKIKNDGWPAVLELDSKRPNERNDRGAWGYQCIGMFRSQQDIDEYWAQLAQTAAAAGNEAPLYMGNTREDVHPGMLIYRDVRGQLNEDGSYGAPDGIVDENDRIEISHRSSNPYGFTINFGINYKSFSLSGQFGASWGSYGIVQTDLRKDFFDDLEYKNVSAMWSDMFVYEDVYDAQGNVTVAANRDAKYPNMKYSSVNNQSSTFWRVNNASITLRNVSVAYTLPKQWLEPIGVSSVRLNLTCQNALNFYNPYPEDAWSSWAGNYGKYPNLRKFTLGVNVSF